MVLKVIIGPMFAGKSDELMRNIRKHRVTNKKIQIFKHSFDTRYSKQCLSSHDKVKIEANIAHSTNEILRTLDNDTEVVVIDEVQFFDDKIIDLCNHWANQGREVVVAGLNLNFLGQPFKFMNSEKTMADLIVTADKITKLSAVCTYRFGGKICGRPATRTQRIVDSKSPGEKAEVLVGGPESYEARCREHHRPISGQSTLIEPKPLNNKKHFDS
ncbi:thymidine kinase [Candidatus Woesearchaeota archaeon]|nr:thymidine kinase [Candidatus Woesearchaeota archaeon]